MATDTPTPLSTTRHTIYQSQSVTFHFAWSLPMCVPNLRTINPVCIFNYHIHNFCTKSNPERNMKKIKFLNLDQSDHQVTLPYQILFHFRNVVRGENLKITQIIKFPNTVIFTFDIEKVINSGHNHYQCVPNLKTICPVPFVLSWSVWQDTIIIPQSLGYGICLRDITYNIHVNHSCISFT